MRDDDAFYSAVDWGDGNIVQGTSTNYSGELKGQTVKIYSTEDITSFGCEEQNITTLDVTKNTALTELWCDNNNLKFSTIKLNTFPTNFSYSPQAVVLIASAIKSGETIDLSSEYEVYGKNTVYKWYETPESSILQLAISDDNEVTPTKSENGVFTFDDEFVGKTLYCEMTNEAFPDLTLKTTSVTVEAKEADDTPIPDTPDQGDTDESVVITIVASCLAVLSLAAIGAVVYKKKFAHSAK